MKTIIMEHELSRSGENIERIGMSALYIYCGDSQPPKLSYTNQLLCPFAGGCKAESGSISECRLVDEIAKATEADKGKGAVVKRIVPGTASHITSNIKKIVDEIAETGASGIIEMAENLDVRYGFHTNRSVDIYTLNKPDSFATMALNTIKNPKVK